MNSHSDNMITPENTAEEISPENAEFSEQSDKTPDVVKDKQDVHSRKETIKWAENLTAGKESALESVNKSITTASEKRITAADNKLSAAIDAYRNNRLNKIDKLNLRNARHSRKIARQERKINKLNVRADRLDMANSTLKSFFGGQVPQAIQAIISANERRIEKIAEFRIPRREKNIAKRVTKIERNNRKLESAKCQVDKAESLDKLIKSFAIQDKEQRRKEFSAALDGLNGASKRSINIKIERVENKIAALSSDYEAASTADKLMLTEKIAKQNVKRASLEKRLAKLSAVKIPFAEQPSETVDKAMDVAEKQVELYDKVVDNPETQQPESLSSLSEKICEKCSEVVPEQEKALESNKPTRESEEKDILAYMELLDNITQNAAVSQQVKEQMKSEMPVPKQEQTEARKFGKTIFGNTQYKDIKNKFYASVTPERAEEISEILNKNGIPHSARIYNSNEAKVTIDKADVKKFRQLTAKPNERTQEEQRQSPPAQRKPSKSKGVEL